MRSSILFLLGAAVVLLLLPIQFVRSQTTEFTYQGNLTTAGAPASGNYDFEFLLFDALTAGAQVGPTVAINTVAVTNGVFNVKLNFGNPFVSGANRFLEIRMRPSGQSGMTILTPRQMIGSAPYAIKSLGAESATLATNSLQLGGVAANQFVLTTDPRMTDARPPTAGSPSYIQNGAVQQPSSNFNISGVGTAGTVNATTQFNIGGSRILANSGINNIFAGIGTGAANTTGVQNSFFGTNAGNSNTTGNGNTFIGALAGDSNSNGGINTFIGRAAGGSNTSGTRNTFVGYDAGFENTTGRANAFFGFEAGFANSSGEDNSFFGTSAGFGTAGNFNSFFGSLAGTINGAGSNNTLIGAKSNVSGGTLNYATAVGAGSIATTSNSINLGRPNGEDTVVIRGNMLLTNLPPGGISPLCITFSTVAICSSSAKYKSNISGFTNGLDLIRKLRPVTFNWKEGGMKDVGLVAEEVGAIERMLTTNDKNGAIDGVKYDRVSVVLINAVKELQAQNETQTEMLKAQRVEIDALKKYICSTKPRARICKPKARR